MAALLNVEPVRTIRLYGVLGATFGREYRLSVASPKEAIRALSIIVPGFERFLNTSKQRGLTYAVFSGNLVLLVDELRQRGIHFKSLTDSIDTSSPMGRFIFHIMSALAEMERELIVERTRAGLAAAREKGRIGGRRPKLTPEQWDQAGRLIANGLDRKQVAIIYDVAVCTLYKKFPASKQA